MILDHRAASGERLHVADLAAIQEQSRRIVPVVLDAMSAFPGESTPSRWASTAVRMLTAHLRHPEPPDVLHAHGSAAIFLSALVRSIPRGQLDRLLFVVTFHGWVNDTRARRLRSRVEIALSSRAQVIIACSPLEIPRLQRRANGPIHHIPNGVRIVDFSEPRATARARLLARWKIPADARLVANVGRMAREKRQDVFLAAAVRILKEIDNAYFLMVGDGPERARVERLVADHGFSDRVRVTGLVDDIPTVMCGADVLLHTADTDASPRVIVEAMAAGTVVVATRVGGVPWLIRDGHDGFLVPRADAAAAAARVVDVLRDDGLRRDIEARARARATRDFSIQKMHESVLRAYEQGLAEIDRIRRPTVAASCPTR